MPTADIMSRRYIPGGNTPGMAGQLPPLPSVGGGGVTPGARPALRAPNRTGGAFVPSPVSPTANGPTDAMGRVMAPVGGTDGGAGGMNGLIPHSVYAGQYANEEQGIVGNAREMLALEREKAIAGG